MAVSSASLRKNWAASKPSTVSASNPFPGPSSAVVITLPRTALLTSNCHQSFASFQTSFGFCNVPRSISIPAFSEGVEPV